MPSNEIEDNTVNPQDDNTVNPQDDADNLPCKQPRDSNMTMEELSENLVSDGKAENMVGTGHVNELRIPPTDTEDPGDDLPHVEKHKSQEPDSVALGTDSSSDDGDEPAAMNEVDFKVSNFVSTFANNTIIQNLCWLLKFYKSNSISTNHYIISMFRRICDDLELSPMLYQVKCVIHSLEPSIIVEIRNSIQYS